MTKTRRTFGTTRQEKSGRFSARYFLEGRQVSIPGTFPSKKAAEARLATIQTELAQGTYIDPKAGDISLADWWRQYRTTKHDWRARTRRNRESVWKLHISPTFGDKTLLRLTKGQVRSWYAALYKVHPATANSAYRLLRQVILAAIEEGLMPAAKNPCKIAGAGIDKSPERQIATVAEVEKIVNTIGERFELIVLLAMWTGLRRSEILGLRRRDIDLAGLTVKVARTVDHGEVAEDGGPLVEDPKSEAGKRVVHFPVSIKANVEGHLSKFVAVGRDAWLFTGERSGEALRPHVFATEFRSARLAAGRPDLTLHDLRHSHLTLAAAKGATTAELMRRAGHSSSAAALRYQHASEDRDRVIAEALSELRPLAEVVELDSRRAEI